MLLEVRRLIDFDILHAWDGLRLEYHEILSDSLQLSAVRHFAFSNGGSCLELLTQLASTLVEQPVNR